MRRANYKLIHVTPNGGDLMRYNTNLKRWQLARKLVWDDTTMHMMAAMNDATKMAGLSQAVSATTRIDL